jgi:hypothetical protein
VGPEQDNRHPAVGKGASYVRLSALPHARDSFSPDRQRDMCREQASRDGVSLVEEHSDLDIPARRNAAGLSRYERLRAKLIESRSAVLSALDTLGPPPMLDIAALLETQLTPEAWEQTPSQRKRDILKLAVQRVYVWRGKRWMQPAEERIQIAWIDAEETDALNLGPGTPRRRDGE